MHVCCKGLSRGITILLLLIVTVGVVGFAYTQLEGLFHDPHGEWPDPEIIIQEVNRVDRGGVNDTMTIRIQNQGDQEYNLTDVARMQYSVPGEYRTSFSKAVNEFNQTTGIIKARECFNGEAPSSFEEFEPGKTASCDTGMVMPDPDDEITLHLVENSSGEEIASYTCSPSSINSSTC